MLGPVSSGRQNGSRDHRTKWIPTAVGDADDYRVEHVVDVTIRSPHSTPPNPGYASPRADSPEVGKIIVLLAFGPVYFGIAII